MDVMTTTFERVVHLALFVAGGVAVGALALAVLERVASEAGRRTIRVIHVAIPALAAFALFVTERVYHLMH